MNSVLQDTLRDGGLVSLPRDVLAAAGVSVGDELIVEVIDGHIQARRDPIAIARTLFREDVALDYTVNYFIAERRAETRRELGEHRMPGD